MRAAHPRRDEIVEDLEGQVKWPYDRTISKDASNALELIAHLEGQVEVLTELVDNMTRTHETDVVIDLGMALHKWRRTGRQVEDLLNSAAGEVARLVKESR